MSEDTKTCPYCAETITPEALVCRYCGRELSATSPEATKSSDKPRRAWWLIVLALLIIVIAVVALKVGVYTVQPIGALPEGRTLLVWRQAGEPVFDSPDALCLRNLGKVSLLCRGSALAAAPVDRIIVRLPYMEWAYLLSTDGREFDR